MRVINVYDKNDDIRSYNRNVFKATETFLAKFPQDYSRCYKHNLETLELFEVDKMRDPSLAGYYDTEANIICFNKRAAVGHELFHMASNDLENNKYAFESKMQIECGLIEGMTEYFNTKAYNLKMPTAYPFEVFCVTMLEDIPDIFKSYFIPNAKAFIKLFPNKRDIYSLLYSLDAYNDMYMALLAEECNEETTIIDINLFRSTVKDALKALIDIKLSLEEDPIILNQYAYKFMENINSSWLKLVFDDTYPKYYEYADKLLDKKIRKRRI